MTWIRTCTVLALLGVSGLANAASSEPADVRAALGRLKPEHPRLIVLQENVDRTRRLMVDRPELRKLHADIRQRAEKMLTGEPLVHRLIGPRLLDQSRLCLDRVYTLATIYRLDGDERFARRAEQEMLTAAAFPDWNPSHFLDTAEMAHALAIGYDWLYEVLSPESRAKIRTAIVEKGLKPAEEVYRQQRWWAKARHNWSQVCNGGVTVAALAVAEDEPELAEYIIEQALTSIRLPFAELAPDGGWAEGPGYWHYAMAYTAYYLAALETALGTDFGLNASPGFRETGLFRIHCIGPANLTFNYADAGAGVGGTPEMFYFAKIFDRPVYAWHQRRYVSGSSPLDLWWYDPRGTDAEGFGLPRAARFSNIDVVFMRSDWKDPDALFVGFKGGDNKANHSHLDLGTFVLDAMGKRWACDLGADNYNAPGYFGKDRWTYYRLRTESHNTLVINGENQDPKAAAPVTAFKLEPERCMAIANLTAAYRPHASDVWRGVRMSGKSSLLIQDEITCEKPLDVAWLMQTNAAVAIDGPVVRLTQDGRKMTLRALVAAGGAWSVEEIKLEPPQKPLKDTRRVALRFNAKPPMTRVAIEFTPGDAKSGAGSIVSLGEWVTE